MIISERFRKTFENRIWKTCKAVLLAIPVCLLLAQPMMAEAQNRHGSYDSRYSHARPAYRSGQGHYDRGYQHRKPAVSHRSQRGYHQRGYQNRNHYNGKRGYAKRSNRNYHSQNRNHYRKSSPYSQRGYYR